MCKESAAEKQEAARFGPSATALPTHDEHRFNWTRTRHSARL